MGCASQLLTPSPQSIFSNSRKCTIVDIHTHKSLNTLLYMLPSGVMITDEGSFLSKNSHSCLRRFLATTVTVVMYLHKFLARQRVFRKLKHKLDSTWGRQQKKEEPGSRNYKFLFAIPMAHGRVKFKNVMDSSCAMPTSRE